MFEDVDTKEVILLFLLLLVVHVYLYNNCGYMVNKDNSNSALLNFYTRVDISAGILLNKQCYNEEDEGGKVEGVEDEPEETYGEEDKGKTSSPLEVSIRPRKLFHDSVTAGIVE